MRCLEKLPETQEVVRARIDARTTLGQYRVQLGEHLAAREAIAPILDAARKLDYRKSLARMGQIPGTTAIAVDEDFPEAFARLEDALRLAEEIGDPVTRVLSHVGLAGAHPFGCEFGEAIDHVSQARVIHRAASSRWGVASPGAPDGRAESLP